ncbi:MAG: type II secretion system F family protein [Candidatus Nezhaarchaeota archaeon]|nr:type II secretion system F family protein [Candidatus Nezhaarchaeota archaeon]
MGPWGDEVDSAAALFSLLTTLCLLTAAKQITPSTTLLAVLIAITLPSQYVLFKKLHVRRAAVSSKAAKELEEVLRNLANKLSLGVALEVAVQEVAQCHRGSLKPMLTKVAKRIAAGHSVEKALESTLNKQQELVEVKRLLLIISKLSKYNNVKAGAVIRQVAELMERNRVVKERLISTFRREELKVRLLSAIYPMVLAALYQLARVMAAMGFLRASETVALNLSLATLSVATPFYATLIVMGEKPLRKALVSLFIYAVLHVALAALPF